MAESLICLAKYCGSWARFNGYCKTHDTGQVAPLRFCVVGNCDDRIGGRYETLCPKHGQQCLRYGMAEADFVAFTATMQCQICGSAERLVVDHDHSCCKTVPTCGKCNRGMVCHKCNTALGMVNDDVETLTAMIRYLT